MKVAVVGAGRWGTNLIRVVCDLLPAGEVQVVDLDTNRLQMVEAQFPGITLSTSLESVLADRHIEAIVVATPASTHPAVAAEALRAGKHVFVEKPLALSAWEAAEVAALADEHDRVLMVGHLLLYQPAVGWIKSAVESGLIGEPWSLHQERLNFGTVRTVENALWSLGVHDVAVVLYIVGQRPGQVVAHGQTVLQAGIHDDVYVHMTFGNRIHAHLHVSWLWPEKRRRLTIMGSRGMIVYDEVTQEVILARRFIGRDLKPVDAGVEKVFRGADDPLRLEMMHFLDCVRTGRRPLSDGRSAVAVVQVLESASKSLGGT